MHSSMDITKLIKVSLILCPFARAMIIGFLLGLTYPQVHGPKIMLNMSFSLWN